MMDVVGIVGHGGDEARVVIEREATRRGWGVVWRPWRDGGRNPLPRNAVVVVRSLKDVAPTLGDGGGFVARARKVGSVVVVVDLDRDLGGESWRGQGGRPRSIPAEVENRIRRRRAEGASYPVIAEELNRDGVPTVRGGKRWWGETVRKVSLRS